MGSHCCLRLSWHGWPVHAMLAESLCANCPVLDTSKIDKAHEMCGSGWAIQCASTVLLVALASVELNADAENTPMQVPRALPDITNHFDIIHVPQNGRCFTSCLWLACMATPQQQKDWKAVLRSNTRMPVDAKSGRIDIPRLKFEEECH